MIKSVIFQTYIFNNARCLGRNMIFSPKETFNSLENAIIWSGWNPEDLKIYEVTL